MHISSPLHAVWQAINAKDRSTSVIGRWIIDWRLFRSGALHSLYRCVEYHTRKILRSESRGPCRNCISFIIMKKKKMYIAGANWLRRWRRRRSYQHSRPYHPLLRYLTADYDPRSTACLTARPLLTATSTSVVVTSVQLLERWEKRMIFSSRKISNFHQVIMPGFEPPRCWTHGTSMQMRRGN